MISYTNIKNKEKVMLRTLIISTFFILASCGGGGGESNSSSNASSNTSNTSNTSNSTATAISPSAYKLPKKIKVVEIEQ